MIIQRKDVDLELFVDTLKTLNEAESKKIKEIRKRMAKRLKIGQIENYF